VSPLPALPGVLTAKQVRDTADSLAALQLPSGQIPWFPGGHCDPWNHVESAMALAVGGRIAEAHRAFDWLASLQHDDGGWHNYYVGPDDEVEDARRDTNVCTYVAVGAWHHYLVTGDRGFLESVWPMVVRAVQFALRLQRPGGQVLWAYDYDGTPERYALLTGSSSIFLSLRCALAAAVVLGDDRHVAAWSAAAARLGSAVAHRPDTAFEPKRRWAMDWYYPVLCGAVGGAVGQARMDDRWDEFVIEGFGIRCVSDASWVTASETAECVLALDACGRVDQARTLLTWVQYLREPDGSYWTGCVHPDEIHFPADERTSYTAAVMLLASDALGGLTGASGLFRGDSLPVVEVEPSLATDR
jgi:hypothetical protein